MKKFTFFFFVCLFAGHAFSQIRPENPEPFLFRPVTHSGNLKSSENNVQAKSFYQSKEDWQTIIDTTWGPGLPLNEKLAIFDTYTGALTTGFAGFNSLGIDPTEWDSIKSSYRSRIDSSTSKGAFAALMGRLAYDLRDCHVRAYDTTIIYTPLNPGIPVLVPGPFEISHFGAVLTVLPDSSLLVLRTTENHPLDLQPGDIVLGYEGVPWKDLVDELLGSGIPIFFYQRNSNSAIRYNELVSAGMNWHLFETIDIVKYASGDTVHLPVYPLVNLPVPTDKTEWWGFMWNNEQLPVPGVPFFDPEEFDERSVTYGIIDGTNIGYINVYAEVFEGNYGFNYTSDDQFYEAVRSLSGTEGLIIDLRYNFGGWSLFDQAFNLLFNIRQPTLEDAIRCNQTDFSLCPVTDYSFYGPPMLVSVKDPNLLFIPGNPMSWYDRPLAILTGPNCLSMGDMTAYRFSYHPMAKFFGKSTSASLGILWGIDTYPEWILTYPITDMFHVNDPDIFLSGREFPVDDSVWFDKDGAAKGEDAVVQKAMEWIQNLSYAHNVLVNPTYAVLGEGTVTLTAKVENPNGHNLSVNARITSLDSTINETVSLLDDGNHNDGDIGDGIWGALWPIPEMKTIFAVDIITEDLTAATSRSIPGAAKFTTIGPVVVDDTTYYVLTNLKPGEKKYFKVFLRNTDLTTSAVNVQAKLKSLDATLANMPDAYISFGDIAPGEISKSLASYHIDISDNCPTNAVIPVKIDISGDYYTYWSDTFYIGLTNINTEDISKRMTRIYPNPADDIINIEINNTGEQAIEIELLTVSGQVIYRKEYINSKQPFVQQIDLSGYAKGVYFLRIRQSGEVYNGKIIVM